MEINNSKNTAIGDMSAAALTLDNLGTLHLAKNEYATAVAYYEEALVIYRKLVVEKLSAYDAELATILNNLAVLYSDKNEFATAETYYEKTLAIHKKLAAENPNIHLAYVAKALTNLGNLHKAKNEFEIAEAYYEECVAIYRNLAAENPSIYLVYLAMALINLANLHFDRDQGGTTISEAYYEEALEIRRKLEAENLKTYSAEMGKWNDSDNLHKAKNEYATAEVFYKEDLEIKRKLAAESSSDYLVSLGMAAANVAIIYTQYTPDKKKAFMYCQEALRAALPFVELLPIAKKCVETVLLMVKTWGADEQAFLQEIIKNTSCK